MSANPPSGTTVGSYGAWNTDYLTDTTTYMVGSSSVKLTNSILAGAKTFGLPYPDLTPVEPGMPYALSAWVRADSIAAGNTIALYANWTDGAKAYLSTSYARAAAVLSAANTWVLIQGVVTAPAGARYARWWVQKANTNFSAWVQTIDVRRMPLCGGFFQNSLQTNIASGDWRTINLDSTEYDYGGFADLANEQIIIPADGVYAVKGQVALTPDGTWTYAQCRLTYTGGYIYGPKESYQFSGNIIEASQQLFLNAGDTVKIQVYPGGSSTFDCGGAILTVVRVGE